MDVIKVIRDADIGSDTPDPETYEERRTARAIVFDKDGKVALLHVTNKGYHTIPGGGIEADEDINEALRRECLEEIGCTIENAEELGTIEEYRGRLALHKISYGFTADVVGEKGAPHLTESETANGFQTVWLDIESAIRTIENEASLEDYAGKFMRIRDLTFLQAAQRRS